MKLSSLAQAILSASPPLPITLQELYDCLDFRGALNSHLAIPENHEPDSYYCNRPSPLTGDEEIRGELLVFDYVDHKNWMTLTEFESLRHVEEFILGEAGIFNVWTTAILVIHRCDLLPYRPSFMGECGTRISFDPKRHPRAGENYPGRRLEWTIEARKLPNSCQ